MSQLLQNSAVISLWNQFCSMLDVGVTYLNLILLVRLLFIDRTEIAIKCELALVISVFVNRWSELASWPYSFWFGFDLIHGEIGSIYSMTWRHVPEEWKLHVHHCKNLDGFAFTCFMIQVFFSLGDSVSEVVIYIWVTWFNHLFQKVLQWYFERYCNIFFV